MISTDHAPHSAEEKSKGFKGSLNGILGLEAALPVMYTSLVEGGVIPVDRLVQLMSTNPAKRFGLPGGELKEGGAADLAVVDLEDVFTIDPSGWKSKGRSTPFEGMKVSGRVIMTMTEGNIVYER
jgi:dihydroorotase